MRTGDSGMYDRGPLLASSNVDSMGSCPDGIAPRKILVSETLGGAPGRRAVLRDFGRLGLAIMSGLGLWLLTSSVQAVEPVQAFTEGMRDRGYYDTALAYLDQLSQQENLPTELKELLPYERAQTLLASARDLNNVDAQRQQLDAAEAAFQQFAKGAPQHPLAAQANTWRGRILFEKARVEIFESEDPSHQSDRQLYQEKAREQLKKSRQVFDDAATQYKKALDLFPAFIPAEEKSTQAARAKAENAYIEVVFDAGKCTYWEARTYDRGSQSASGALQKASVEFTEMHDRYRNNTGGKFARLWQGKCFEELDQITQAIGVYDDLLSLTPDTAVKAALYDLALRFKLICLNHEQKKDYPLVVTLAEEWMNSAKGRTRSEVGNGIQWELCRALEKIGSDSTKLEAERAAALTQALTRTRLLSRTSGEFKAPANAMIQRLLRSLNRSTDEPTDFDSAYGMAGKLSDDLRQLREQIATAQQTGNLDEARAKQATLQASAAEMARLCDLALRIAKSTTPAADIQRANLLLAYGYLLNDRAYEAAAVGEHMLRTLAVRSPETAKNAGFIAMAAFDRAYQREAKGQREFETRKLLDYASLLEQKFPESDQTNEARLAVARVMWDERQLDEAAVWWSKIPSGATHYAGAQLSTGQAYWGQYTSQINLPESQRPEQAKFVEWREAAIRHLEIGIAERTRSTPVASATPEDLTRGKVTLAQIRNLSGVYRTVNNTLGSIELLTSEPHSVVAAISVPRDTPRPKAPGNPKSRVMASFAYQQLLKAQIGVKDLEAAREARYMLEEVAGSDDAESLTQVFVEFGQELEKELKQLKAAGETSRADEVREGFESFLNDLFQREEGQSFTSLFWIAETFTSLAESSADDQSRAQEFLTKASEAYLKIIEKSTADRAFAQPDQLLYSKMRLVNCQQAQGNFSSGERLVRELLANKQAVESPNVQFTAASFYQAWAGSSEPDAWKKYEIAVLGAKSPVVIWGWAFTARRLQKFQQKRPDPRYAMMEFDARYNLGVCQLALARQLVVPADREKNLTQARSGVATFARIAKVFPPDQYERFNTLYRDIVQECGELPVDLPVGQGGGDAAPEMGAPDPDLSPGTSDPVPGADVVAESKPQPVATTNYGMIALLGFVGIGAVAGILWMSRKPPNRYTSRRTVEPNFMGTPVESERDAGAPSEPRPAPAAAPPKPKPTRLPGKPKSGPS